MARVLAFAVSAAALVAPPTRSAVYTLRTGNDGPDLQVVSNTQVSGGSTDPTSYVPGELMPLYLKVVQKMIQRMEDAGRPNGWESSKYIGLLLYAVRMGDRTEEKVGSWEIPLEEPARFWTPDDAPGCSGKALMHRYAEPKHFLEIVRFRAPPAGTTPKRGCAFANMAVTLRKPSRMAARSSRLAGPAALCAYGVAM